MVIVFIAPFIVVVHFTVLRRLRISSSPLARYQHQSNCLTHATRILEYLRNISHDINSNIELHAEQFCSKRQLTFQSSLILAMTMPNNAPHCSGSFVSGFGFPSPNLALCARRALANVSTHRVSNERNRKVNDRSRSTPYTFHPR